MNLNAAGLRFGGQVAIHLIQESTAAPRNEVVVGGVLDRVAGNNDTRLTGHVDEAAQQARMSEMLYVTILFFTLKIGRGSVDDNEADLADPLDLGTDALSHKRNLERAGDEVNVDVLKLEPKLLGHRDPAHSR